MSKTVNYIGKIKEIKIPKNINLVEDVVKYLSEKFNISIEDFEMKNGDILYIDSDKIHYNYKTRTCYEVLEKEYVDHDEDYFIAKKENEIISFNLKFYNGGCSFDEALSEAIEKI